MSTIGTHIGYFAICKNISEEPVAPNNTEHNQLGLMLKNTSYHLLALVREPASQFDRLSEKRT